MKKNKFYKNLYQTLSYFGVALVLDLPLLFGYIDSLNYEKNNGYILLILSILLLVLFFVIGFYWIFQQVIINEKGIQVILMKKIIKECNWDEIKTYEITSIMRNPAIRVKLFDDSEIHLDKRKSIINAIEFHKIDLTNE